MSGAVTINDVPGQVRRRGWMDVLRGVAVSLVVLAHAGLLTEFYSGFTFPGLQSAVSVINPLRMPLLFLLSGLLVPRSLAKGTWNYLRGKLTKVLYPYVLWTIVLIVIGMVTAAQIAPPNLLFALLQPETTLWFLGYLFCYYLIALLCRWVHPLVIATAALALGAILVDGQWERFWDRAVPFFIGVAIGRSIDGFETFLRQRVLCWVLLLAASAAMVSHVLWGWGVSDTIWMSVITVAFVVGVTGAIMPIAEASPLKPLRYLGKNTIKLYILHWTFIELTLRWLSQATTLGPRPLLGIAVFVAFVPPILVMLLADRFRVVDWLFEWNPRREERRGGELRPEKHRDEPSARLTVP